MSTDIGKRFVPPVFNHDERARTSRDSLAHGNSNTRFSTPEHDFPLGTGKRKPSGGLVGQRSNSSPSERVMHEATSWQGDERIRLVQEGYRSLAIICTFIAGVQAQALSMTLTSTGLASQIIHAFFFTGLLANIGAATLSAASARWFEMMTPEEAKHVYNWLNSLYSPSDEEEQGDSFPQGAEEEKRQTGDDDSSVTSPQCYYIVERCLCIALRAAPFVAVLGLVFLVAGVMLWVWTHEALVVRVLCTAMCALLAILLPPFAISHNRIKTLTFFKLRRFSG